MAVGQKIPVPEMPLAIYEIGIDPRPFVGIPSGV
jgi:hypothetical protein